MKKLVAMSLSFVFAASVCGIAIAYDQAAATTGKGGKMTMEQRQQDRLAKMTKELGLTADQQSNISVLMTARNEKMKGAKKNKDDMKAIFTDYNTQVKAVLTPDQVKKYDKMMEKEKAKHQEKQQDKQ